MSTILATDSVWPHKAPPLPSQSADLLPNPSLFPLSWHPRASINPPSSSHISYTIPGTLPLRYHPNQRTHRYYPFWSYPLLFYSSSASASSSPLIQSCPIILGGHLYALSYCWHYCLRTKKEFGIIRYLHPTFVLFVWRSNLVIYISYSQIWTDLLNYFYSLPLNSAQRHALSSRYPCSYLVISYVGMFLCTLITMHDLKFLYFPTLGKLVKYKQRKSSTYLCQVEQRWR